MCGRGLLSVLSRSLAFTAGTAALRLSRCRSWSCCLRTRQRTLSGLIVPLLAQQAAPCRMVTLCFGRSG